MPRLSAADSEQRMRCLTGLRLEGDQITNQVTFAGFPESLRVVDSLVLEAEAADQHPDIQINYQRVTLTYSPHSEGGLTEKDFAGAALADRAAHAAQKNV